MLRQLATEQRWTSSVDSACVRKASFHLEINGTHPAKRPPDRQQT